MTVAETLHRARALLAGLYLFGAVGIVAELLLLEHTEDSWQLIPLGLLGLGSGALIGALIFRRPALTRVFQAVMLLTVASAVAGLWLHLDANLEFEREIRPDLVGWPLLWKSVHGTAPPALAPGAMALLGCIGGIWAFVDRHLRTDTSEPIPPYRHSKPTLQTDTSKGLNS